MTWILSYLYTSRKTPPLTQVLRSSAFLASMHVCVFYCFGTRRQQILMTKSWCFSYQGVLQFLAFHSVQFAKFWIIPQCTVGKRVGISLTKRIFLNLRWWFTNFLRDHDASVNPLRPDIWTICSGVYRVNRLI